MSFLKRRFGVILLVLFLIAFGQYYISHQNDFTLLTSIKSQFLLLAIIGHLSIIGLNAVINWRLLAPLDIHITVKDSVYVSLISSIGSFFLPMQSGAGFRAVFLNKKYGLTYSKFGAVLAGNFIIVFLINSLAGLAAILYLRNSASLKEIVVITGVFLSIFIMSFMTIVSKSAIVILKRVVLKIPIKRYKKAIHSLDDGWRKIISDNKLLLDLSILAFLGVIINILIIYFELSSLGLAAGVWSMLLYAALGSIVLLVNITPASLGIRESIFIFSAAALGLSVSQILTISIIDRTIKLSILSSTWMLMHANSFFKKRKTT